MVSDETITGILSAVCINDELPDYIVDAINRLVASPERLTGKESELRTLLEQLEDYDPHAGIGCFGGGVSAASIQRTLDLLFS